MTRKTKHTVDGRRSGLVVAIALMFAASTAAAGSLAVTGASAHTGSYGLEVTVGSSCTSDTDLVLDNVGTISSDQEGCDTITAGGTTTGTTVSGTVTFTAGTLMTFTNGFSVTTGSDFTAAIDATLTPFAWVQDDSPANEVTYSAEFYVNPDGLTMGGSFEHFVAYSGSTEQLRVNVNSSKQVVLEVRDDAGTYHATAPINLGAGWNKVAISWEAAASATASIAVNDGSAATVSGIDTDARRIASIRWGAIGGSPGTTSGTMDQDDFVSWR